MLRKSFLHQLNELDEKINLMSQMVDNIFKNTIDALLLMDMDESKKVMEFDDEIDNLHHQIERQCIDILALQQPLASDLRKIASFLKIINDIERIADQCCDICNIICTGEMDKDMILLSGVVDMLKKVYNIYFDTISALKNKDEISAVKIRTMDDDIDKAFLDIVVRICDHISESRSKVKKEVDLIFIAKYIERIADHCMNISIWIVYMQTGLHEIL